MGYALQLLGAIILIPSGLYLLNSILAGVQGDTVETLYAIPAALFFALSFAFLRKGRAMIRASEAPAARR